MIEPFLEDTLRSLMQLSSENEEATYTQEVSSILAKGIKAVDKPESNSELDPNYIPLAFTFLQGCFFFKNTAVLYDDALFNPTSPPDMQKLFDL